MPQIDPVILQLRADMTRYQADLKASTSLAEASFKRQERAVQRLESQMRASSGAIGGQIKGLATSLAGYFSGRELVGLIDSFTRLQNNLRIVGLEGEKLQGVQERLFVSAQKYGVSVEDLSQLFGKSTQAVQQFGGTQTQVFGLTDAVSKALKIQGTSAQEARGALLQLAQALQTGNVRAEEFNSVNEGMFPILQAAARGSERWGGSIAKLRQDVIAGKVTSQAFFEAILAGSKTLDGPASKATLTLSGGFATLGNALTIYFGEASKANGVTAALSQTMASLAANLDTIIPALAVIGVVAFGRFAGGALAGAAAIRAISAYAAIATTSLAGTALAARAAGAALLGALGGPVGVAITALTLGIGYLIVKTGEVDAATGAYAKAQSEAEAVTSRAATAADKLASAHGKAREEALALARAERENIKQKLASAKASLVLAQAELARAREVQAIQQSVNASSLQGGGDVGVAALIQKTGGQSVGQANANAKAAADTLASLGKSLEAVNAAINGAEIPKVAGSGGKTKKAKNASGPSAAEIEARFNDDLRSIQTERLQDELAITDDATKRRELGTQLDTQEFEARLAQIEAEKNYSRAQKAALIKALENRFGRTAKGQNGDDIVVTANTSPLARARRREEVAQLERESADLAQAVFDVESATLHDQYDLAQTQAQRRDLATQILDLEYRHKEATLEQIIASEATTAAEKERARVTLAGLADAKTRDTEKARRDTAGPLERFGDDLKNSTTGLNEQLQGIAVDGLKSLNDGLTDAIVNSKDLGDVFGNVANAIIADLVRIAIQQAIIVPLFNALGSAFGIPSVGGGLGSLFGRASGGYVAPGQMVRVNEAGSAGRVEGFRPVGGGTVVPLGQMNVAAAPSGGSRDGQVTVRLVLSDDLDQRIASVSGNVAVEVVKASAPSIVDGAVNETFRRGQRFRL